MRMICIFYICTLEPHYNTDFGVFLWIGVITELAFPADIGRMPALPARGNRQCLQAGDAGDGYTPANETADDTKDRDLVSLNMAVPVWNVSAERDNMVALVFIFKIVFQSSTQEVYRQWEPSLDRVITIICSKRPCYNKVAVYLLRFPIQHNFLKFFTNLHFFNWFWFLKRIVHLFF